MLLSLAITAELAVLICGLILIRREALQHVHADEEPDLDTHWATIVSRYSL